MDGSCFRTWECTLKDGRCAVKGFRVYDLRFGVRGLG
jgi:hypothetical protein